LLIVCVVDTGVGIPVEHLPHIFERFRQVDSSTTRAHGGLGLGLAIVRHLVEAHGGTVNASSDGAGHGATFTVSLPVRGEVDDQAIEAGPDQRSASSKDGGSDGDEAASESDGAPSSSSRSLGELSKTRVLVVDDEPDSLELLRLVFEEAGARVTAARSAIEALGARGPFDAIVSDIGMPEMDGYSLIRSIRSRKTGSAVPAIALTAYARSEDIQQAFDAGFQHHLAKPVDGRKVVEIVKLILRETRGERKHGTSHSDRPETV
jgi:CheY-like chemotaxis protein